MAYCSGTIYWTITSSLYNSLFLYTSGTYYLLHSLAVFFNKHIYQRLPPLSTVSVAIGYNKGVKLPDS